MNVTETAEVLTLMLNAWPSAKVNEGTPKIWAEMLIGVDPRDGAAAAKGLMGSSKFFPSIAEFKEAARAEQRARAGDDRVIEHRKQLANPERGQEDEQPTTHRTRAEQIAYNREWIAEFKRRPSSVPSVEGFKTLGESLGAMLDTARSHEAQGETG